MADNDKYILVVDDNDINRLTLKVILDSQYNVLQASNGSEAIEMIYEYRESLTAVLLDLIMPGIDGIQVLDKMHEEGITNEFPFIVITSDNTPETEEKCFERGVADFIGKPSSRALILNRVKYLVEIYDTKKNLERKVDDQTTLLKRVVETLKAQKEQIENQAEALKYNHDQLQIENANIIEMMGSIAEYRVLDKGDKGHRLKQSVRLIGQKYLEMFEDDDFNEDTLDVLVVISPLHDIGKISIPDTILNKPGLLTDDETDYLRSHTLRGCEIIEQMKGTLNDYYVEVAYDVCRSHHESYDGTGYPDGLSGYDIKATAQIVAIANELDKLIHPKDGTGISFEDATHTLLIDRRSRFSPKVIEAFRKAEEEIDKLYK